jgi:hypothetical protein
LGHACHFFCYCFFDQPLAAQTSTPINKTEKQHREDKETPATVTGDSKNVGVAVRVGVGVDVGVGVSVGVGVAVGVGVGVTVGVAAGVRLVERGRIYVSQCVEIVPRINMLKHCVTISQLLKS